MLVFPSRASTQTWMILTFALFVGMAVLVVALYVGFVLRGEMQDATRQMLVQQAQRVASQIEQAETPEERVEFSRAITRLTDLQIAVLQGDGTRWATEGGRDVEAPDLEALPEVAQAREDGIGFVRSEAAGRDRFYVALDRPGSGLVVRVGQPEPPLFTLVERLQVALVVGMMMALLLALLGSWVAAQQVTRPLQTISESARHISEGEFEGRIRVDSRAIEFEELARSLNRMAGGYREKIREMERMAQIQNEFIGNVSHEVRNPIHAVGGYLEALSSPGLKPEQQRVFAQKGIQNLERLANLFNDLIEIARLEYREDLIQPREFDLRELTEEVAEVLRPKAEAKGLDLQVQNPSVFVRADRNRMRQVLTNLIENAIAYTDEGTVRCRFRRRLDKVRVEVIDTGKGIPEDHRERIFERFYRVDPDRSRKSGGTGLGLSIVKQILHAHGEAIHVESTPGRGSRFWFELPYAEQPADADA